jgi:calcineurin-like phosphoesterase family protein
VTTWFIGDPHLGHAKVSGLRGFLDISEHDAAVLGSIKMHVRPEDVLWILGDLTCTPRDDVVRSGLAEVAALGVADVRLVTGNHDQVWAGHREAHKWMKEYVRVFGWITPFARLRIAGEMVLLSHFPYAGGGDHTAEDRYAQYRLPDLGGVLVHGHTHSADRVSQGPGGGLQICACWEAWGRPVSDREVSELIRDTSSLF